MAREHHEPTWRKAGFPDEDAREVRDWVRSKLRDAEQALATYMDRFDTGLEEPIRLGRLLDLDDPEHMRLAEERARWQRLLDKIDDHTQPTGAGFMEAHREFTKAHQQG